jgi:hypothetical protein
MSPAAPLAAAMALRTPLRSACRQGACSSTCVGSRDRQTRLSVSAARDHDPPCPLSAAGPSMSVPGSHFCIGQAPCVRAHFEFA